MAESSWWLSNDTRFPTLNHPTHTNVESYYPNTITSVAMTSTELESLLVIQSVVRGIKARQHAATLRFIRGNVMAKEVVRQVELCQALVRGRVARTRFNALVVQHSTRQSGVELPVAVETEFGTDDPTDVDLPVISPKMANLISKTKVIDDSPEAGPLVTGWDSKELRNLCLPSSIGYDPSIEVADLCRILFPPGQWWSNRMLLVDALSDCAKISGFKVTHNHSHIRCNRHGKSKPKRKSKTKRNFEAGSLAQECTLMLHLKAMHKTTVQPKRMIDGKCGKPKKREDWNRETCIIKETSKPPHQQSCWYHGGTCTPGIQNLVQVSSRAGVYAKTVSSKQMFSLCRQAAKKRLTVAQIKGALHDLMPSNTKVTRQHVYYLRVKVMKLLPIVQDNPEYENFKLYVNDNQIIHGIDDEVEIDDDLAHKLCTDLWLEALADHGHDENGSVHTLTSYMNLLAASAPGFSYSIAMDDEGKATGIAWMTGTMRDNFERYGNDTI